MDNIIQADERGVTLSEAISLNEVISADGAVFSINFDNIHNCRTEEESTYNETILPHVNLECLGLKDEETYDDLEPFEQLATKMTNLLEDGRIKKRIIRDGVGDVVQPHGTVIYDYNAYIEYSEEPFDSTYTRNKSHIYKLDSGNTLPGLDIALHSMKINEKAQFLIQPELAYGKMGCLHRVPPNSPVLFEIEVKNCQNTGAVTTFANLSEEEQNTFPKIYSYATALCLKGNELYAKNCYKQAIREYNMAVSKLLHCTLADYDDQEQQQLLLFRLYMNLVVVYTKDYNPRKACTKCNEIFHLTKGTSMKIPAKVYFNNARALMMLSDFEGAEKKLKIAKRLQPNNPTISQEFVKLDSLKKENNDRQMILAKALFKNNDINKELHEQVEVTEDLKKIIGEYCSELKSNPNISQFTLPQELNTSELAFIKHEAATSGLNFYNNDGKYYISKRSEKNE